MSSEGILENPAIFTDKAIDLDFFALEYMDFAKKYNPEFRCIKAHIFKFFTSLVKVRNHP